MRRVLMFIVGVFVGQWLVFGGAPSPADLHARAAHAFEQRDYVEAMRLWSHAVSLQPDNPSFHYYRGAALAGLGLRLSAADAYQTTLFLDPPRDVARQAIEGLARLNGPAPADAMRLDVTVPLEPGLGVWITPVLVNETHTGRFLVDTGSSVTVISPAFARSLGLAPRGASESVELQTLAGRTAGPAATVSSLRVGTAELRDAPVVLHDPGPGLDGILGNTFLGRYRITLDGDRRQLLLRPTTAALRKVD
ncbi:MAG TPA: aspartyl protease family protein [Methylomirabilota bacterium]|jgi:aspartyl protease family protein|nr:aspartyl protease family protein [Methylomirabilota bacterium]